PLPVPYGRGAAAYVQSFGLKAVAVVSLRLINSRSPRQDKPWRLFVIWSIGPCHLGRKYMFCIACGEKLHEKAIICPQCGVTTHNYGEKETEFNNNALVWFYVAAAILPVFGFVLGIYAFLKKKYGHGCAILILSFFMWGFWLGLLSLLS